MATILFLPYPETTHLNDSFKLAKALKSRGHSVSYLSLLDFEDHAKSQGFDLLPCFKDIFPKGFIHQHAVKKNIENFEVLLSQVIVANQLKEGFDPLKELDEILGKIFPSLVIIDKLLPDIALRIHNANIPIVILNPHLFNLWEDDPKYRSLSSAPELVLCSREFDFPRQPRKKHCYYIGANVDLERKEISFPWDQLDKNKPLIYCALGNQSHLVNESKRLLQAVIDAFIIRQNLQLVLSIGDHLSLEAFHSVPANAILVSKAPQLGLLNRASIMISQGGFSSVKECILFGVPMIVFPTIRDHPAIAARVVYHGLGVRGNIRDVCANQVISLIDQVEREPLYKARVSIMSKQFRADESSGRGVQVIEKFMSS